MKYLVPITRECTETTTVDVEASSPAEAVALALEEAQGDPNAFEWVADDCSGDSAEPYFAGGDDLDAVEEA